MASAPPASVVPARRPRVCRLSRRLLRRPGRSPSRSHNPSTSVIGACSATVDPNGDGLVEGVTQCRCSPSRGWTAARSARFGKSRMWTKMRNFAQRVRVGDAYQYAHSRSHVSLSLTLSLSSHSRILRFSLPLSPARALHLLSRLCVKARRARAEFAASRAGQLTVPSTGRGDDTRSARAR